MQRQKAILSALFVLGLAVTVIVTSSIYFPRVTSQGNQLNDVAVDIVTLQGQVNALQNAVATLTMNSDSYNTTVLASGTFNWGFGLGSGATTTKIASNFTLTEIHKEPLKFVILTLQPPPTPYIVPGSGACSGSVNIGAYDFSPDITKPVPATTTFNWISETELNKLNCIQASTCVIDTSYSNAFYFNAGSPPFYIQTNIYDYNNYGTCTNLRGQSITLTSAWELVFYDS